MRENGSFEQLNVYTPSATGSSRPDNFLSSSGNSDFRFSILTWVSLAVLLIAYPLFSIATAEDPSELLKGMSAGELITVLVVTIAIQWFMFLAIFVSVNFEKTGMKGLGFKSLRTIDFAYAAAFLLGAFGVLVLLELGLASIGLPMSGEIALLVPQDMAGRIVWVVLSLSAGICEETAFRGYLMTRLRIVGRFNSWVVPTVVSAVVFGACHAYQGWPGFIVISVYGAMLSLLYIRTGSIWPGIIAHFLQDFGALFYPQ